jgi:hypothetical protein
MARPAPALFDGENLRFEQPEFGVSPGQAAVIYDGDRVLGGGWIEETIAAELRRPSACRPACGPAPPGAAAGSNSHLQRSPSDETTRPGQPGRPGSETEISEPNRGRV